MGQIKAVGPRSVLNAYQQAVHMTSPSKTTQARRTRGVPRQDGTDLSVPQTMFSCRNWLERQMSRASPIIPKAWEFPLK